VVCQTNTVNIHKIKCVKAVAGYPTALGTGCYNQCRVLF
jgi:hypothetical protein